MSSRASRGMGMDHGDAFGARGGDDLGGLLEHASLLHRLGDGAVELAALRRELVPASSKSPVGKTGARRKFASIA